MKNNNVQNENIELNILNNLCDYGKKNPILLIGVYVDIGNEKKKSIPLP